MAVITCGSQDGRRACLQGSDGLLMRDSDGSERFPLAHLRHHTHFTEVWKVATPTDFSFYGHSNHYCARF
jgi:hypothetical protein